MSVRMSGGSTLAALALVCGCTPGAQHAETTPGDTLGRMEELRGPVSVTGSEPLTHVILQPSGGGGAITLVGDLEPELRRLAGATLRVEGVRTSAPPAGAGLDVQRYQIELIDGREPTVGVVVLRGGGVWLADGDTVRLADPPDELRARPGAKVWVLGRKAGDTLEIESYGLIREYPTPGR